MREQLELLWLLIRIGCGVCAMSMGIAWLANYIEEKQKNKYLCDTCERCIMKIRGEYFGDRPTWRCAHLNNRLFNIYDPPLICSGYIKRKENTDE